MSSFTRCLKTDPPEHLTLRELRELATARRAKGNIKALNGFIGSIEFKRHRLPKDKRLIYQGIGGGCLIELRITYREDEISEYLTYHIQTRPAHAEPLNIINR